MDSSLSKYTMGLPLTPLKIGFAAFALLVLTACAKPSVTLIHDGKTLASCKDAELSELFPKADDKNPKGGGYRYTCNRATSNATSIYITYDTTGGPMQGTIKRVSIYKSNSQQDLRVATSNDTTCPAVKKLTRTAGEPPLPTALFGSPKTGSYHLLMADPCGKLVMKIE